MTLAASGQHSFQHDGSLRSPENLASVNDKKQPAKLVRAKGVRAPIPGGDWNDRALSGLRLFAARNGSETNGRWAWLSKSRTSRLPKRQLAGRKKICKEPRLKAIAGKSRRSGKDGQDI